MDRTKTRDFRNRTRFGTRLKYTSRPGVPTSPTAPSFVIERRLPKNYKTIKTSSRSTVATSSSLSTFNLEEDVATDRFSPNHDDTVRESIESPKQAFKTNRELSDQYAGEDMIVINKQVTEKLPKISSKKEKEEVKGSGHDFHDKSHQNVEQMKSYEPKSIKNIEENIKLANGKSTDEQKEKAHAISVLDDNLQGDDNNVITKGESTNDTETKNIKKMPKTETFSAEETEKEWQPITTKPKASGAQDPRDKCLNECGKCGDAENKLKLLPCLHSFCLKCLKGMVTETHKYVHHSRLYLQSILPNISQNEWFRSSV